MGKLKDLTGKRFNMLSVIERAGISRSGGASWLCVCDCGNRKVYSSDHLIRKRSPIKSCGCLLKRNGSEHPLWNGVGDISGNWWHTHVLRERNQIIRIRIPVEITIEYAWDLFLKQNRKCKYTGLPLEISGTHHYNTASIDRIDSSRGYVADNIQWVHKDVNFMKRAFTHEYFVRMCKLIASNSSIEIT